MRLTIRDTKAEVGNYVRPSPHLHAVAVLTLTLLRISHRLILPFHVIFPKSYLPPCPSVPDQFPRQLPDSTGTMSLHAQRLPLPSPSIRVITARRLPVRGTHVDWRLRLPPDQLLPVKTGTRSLCPRPPDRIQSSACVQAADRAAQEGGGQLQGGILD